MSRQASPEPSCKTIFRILSAADWRLAQGTGAFRGSVDDARDGFIHFSTADQVADTALRHYAGRDGLVLLHVDVEALGPKLVWERSRGGALFPHLYGELPVSAVWREDLLPLGPDGHHVFPPLR